MRKQSFPYKQWLPVIGWCCCVAPAGAQVDTTNKTAPTALVAAPAAAPSSAIKLGVDYYSGVSNVDGARRFSDGFWAGSAAAYPSVGYLRWDDENGSAAKLSVGLGKMYTESESALDQPVEAWWQVPAGKASVTVGKFWVPFALQEWEYESKPGVMLQWAQGSSSVAASANYNRNTRTANTYLRLGQSLGKDASLGVSLGAGKGLSYDSGHDRGWGLDATIARQGWRLSTEYVELRNPSSQPFRFGYGKLSYENAGAWKPFIARYTWNDAAEELGRFHSTTYGLGYQVTPSLALEGAYADTSDKNASWVQLHWTWER